MGNTVGEVLQFVKVNDVKFVRLAFCDLFGRQKNISVAPETLEAAFNCGRSFDASAIRGFSGVSNSDLFLYPDPSTLSLLPWRPSIGRVARFFCDIKKHDGEDYACDPRSILRRAAKRCEDAGYTCQAGAECEFYLFKTDENGNPTMIPADRGGFFDVSPLDGGENVRREICLDLAEMGLRPDSSHHEQGPGQNEIDIKYADALTAADNIMAFKTAVKAIAARNGLFASFLPKPFPNKCGSGLHLNFSLSSDGRNVFKPCSEGHNKVAESFIAGVLAKAPEITLFLNPLPNSYLRFGTFEAPDYVSWAYGNRSQLIRIPAASGERVRMELRSPDPSSNPYLALALIISAGLYGIEHELPLSPPLDADLYTAGPEITGGLVRLPHSLTEAIEFTKSSSFAKDALGEDAFNNFVAAKKIEEDIPGDDTKAYFPVV